MKLSKQKIAKVIREVNKAYCESIGDDSLFDWSSEEHKASYMDAVDFHMKNDATPEESHTNWREHKYDNGWEWAPDKAEDWKQHPNLVMFEKLPQEQKSKHYIVKAIVRTLMDI